MTAKVKLSSRLLTDVFWTIMFQKDEELAPQKSALFERLSTLDELRNTADYDTGSISYSAAWSLYNVVRHFRPRRIIEVGTFIGKSTIAMAAALDDHGAPGEIFTCDGSNDIKLPWDGETCIRQFPKTLSGDMFKQIEAPCDMVFLDGRLKKQDLQLLDPLVSKDTLFVLDDFEGMEKGVINLTALMSMDDLNSHFLIFPPGAEWISRRGYSSHTLVAVLMPTSWFTFARQG